MFAATTLRPFWVGCLALGTGVSAWSGVSPARSEVLPPVSTTATDLQTEPAVSSLWQTDRQAATLNFDPSLTPGAIAPPEPVPDLTAEFAAPSPWLSQATDSRTPIDVDPEILEGSPVLQRWLEEIPDVLHDIRHDPSFRSRLRLGYSYFPSTDRKSGWLIGIEDFFLSNTGLTVSAEYQGAFAGGRETWGGDLRYYLLPLGSYINVAPMVGYRNITTKNYRTEGVNVGAKLILALSRTGAADISLSQSFVSPGSANEVGITTLSTGYAVTEDLRFSVDLQKQNSVGRKDSRVGFVLEWML